MPEAGGATSPRSPAGAASPSARIPASPVAARIVTAVAALLILGIGLGPALAEISPTLGLRLAPWDAALQHQAAHDAFAAGQSAPALVHARRALHLMPLDQPSLAIAALQLAPARATTALNQAASLGWRDAATNILLYRAALRENAPDIAATRVDALGRIAGAEIAGPLADNLLAYPGGLKAMADRAAHHLGFGWLPPYLATPPKTAEAIALRSAFVASIDADDGAWLREMVGRASEGFGKAGHPEAGYALWRETLALKPLIAGPFYDPEFRGFGQGAPMGGDWAPIAGGPADVAPAGDGGVTISALGTLPGNVLSQMFVPPERIALSIDWSGPHAAVSAYSWSIECVAAGKIALFQTLTQAGSGWNARIDAVRPPGCALGYLTLNQTSRLSEGTAVTLRRVGPALQR